MLNIINTVSRGMILASGARGPGFKSRTSPTIILSFAEVRGQIKNILIGDIRDTEEVTVQIPDVPNNFYLPFSAREQIKINTTFVI